MRARASLAPAAAPIGVAVPSAALVAAALAVAVAPRPARAEVTETRTNPLPGVVYRLRVDDAIPTRAHIVSVDLSSKELRLVATREDRRGQKVSSWAAETNVQIAVNGDLFHPVSFAPAGLAAGDGALWTTSADTPSHGFLVFDRAGDENHARIEPPESVVGPDGIGPEVEGIVGGRPLLVRAGVAQTTFDCSDALTLPCERAPRTAVGLSADRRTMFLVVVDGWQAASHGMTAGETAALLASLGAHDALALDPGSSSALYVQGQGSGGLVSRPSDGVERVVANHLGVRYGALPPGTMIGFVRERDIFDPTKGIAGAVVRLDDGRTTTASSASGSEGRYSFTDLTPRYTCATASAPGYRPATSCRDVPSGGMVFNSIALFPETDPVDAAPPPPDAPAPPDAAKPPGDGGSGGGDGGGGGGIGGDGGTGRVGAGGGCGCRVAGRGGLAAAEPLGPVGGTAGREGAGAALAGALACTLLGFRAMLVRVRELSRRRRRRVT